MPLRREHGSDQGTGDDGARDERAWLTPHRSDPPTGRLVKRRARRLEDGRSVTQFAKWLGAANSLAVNGRERVTLVEDIDLRHMRLRVVFMIKETAADEV